MTIRRLFARRDDDVLSRPTEIPRRRSREQLRERSDAVSYSVINPGQAGILTMEAIVDRPMAVNGMIGQADDVPLLLVRPPRADGCRRPAS